MRRTGSPDGWGYIDKKTLYEDRSGTDNNLRGGGGGALKTQGGGRGQVKFTPTKKGGQKKFSYSEGGGGYTKFRGTLLSFKPNSHQTIFPDD